MVSTRQGKAGGIFVGRADPAAALVSFREHVVPLTFPDETLSEAWQAVVEPLAQALADRAADGARIAVEDAQAGLAGLGVAAHVPIWPLFVRALDILPASGTGAGLPVSAALLKAIRDGDRALAVRLARDAVPTA